MKSRPGAVPLTKDRPAPLRRARCVVARRTLRADAPGAAALDTVAPAPKHRAPMRRSAEGRRLGAVSKGFFHDDLWLSETAGDVIVGLTAFSAQ